MRLRYVLISLFLFITIVPLSIFWAWPHSQSLQSELDDVRDRHLLLARNLGTALQRYHRDVSSAFNLLVINLIEKNKISNAESVLANLGLKRIFIINENSGNIIANVGVSDSEKKVQLEPERLKILSKLAIPNKNIFSPVMEGADKKPIMYVVKRRWGHLSIGALSTDYFVRLGKAIAFGVKGHAAIIDQEGNVLAHPLDSWIAARRNIAKVSAVKRMLNGETGIETFFSPALKGDMIAGFTAVAGTGWGVMIPQPIIELQQKANHIKNSSLVVFAFGLVVSCVAAFIVSVLISNPIERINRASNNVVDGKKLKEINEVRGYFLPLEFRNLQSSFNAMVRKLQFTFMRIKKLAYQDTVTSLPNRAFFMRHVGKQIDYLKQRNKPQGLMLFIDMDGFKAVNDTFGHDSGDEILRQFSKRIRNVIIQESIGQIIDIDTVSEELSESNLNEIVFARLGGDEFAIFLPNCSEQRVASTLSASILKAVFRPFKIGCQEALIGASIGVSIMPKDSDDFSGLLKYADIAMYHAKNTGKNKVEFFNRDIEDRLLTVERVKQEFHKALKSGELELYYQPRFNLETKCVDCLETLVRWNHPEKGFQSPGQFLPYIEDTDLVLELDDWVLSTAMRQLKQWGVEYPALALSVNVSSRQLADASRAEHIVKKLEENNIDASRIELEITEHAVLKSEEVANRFLSILNKAGFKIAIDDFGRGYSNFSRLINLQFDTIKIDQSMLENITTDTRVPNIIRTLINMAEGVGANVVVEGVETTEQAALLNDMNCPEIQGYLISPPLPENEIRSWLNCSETHVHKLQDDISTAFG